MRSEVFREPKAYADSKTDMQQTQYFHVHCHALKALNTLLSSEPEPSFAGPSYPTACVLLLNIQETEFNKISGKNISCN